MKSCERKQEGPEYNRTLLVLLDAICRFSDDGRDPLLPRGPLQRLELER